MLSLFLLALLAGDPLPPGEQPVAPYAASDANAGAAPFHDAAMWRSFHGQAGVDRIVDDFVGRNVADPRIGEIFRGQNLARLRRTLKEQFCYILNGGCGYSGRTMRDAHKNLGIQTKDMNALVDNLQLAMARERVPFPAQNRFLAKLAPMKRDVAER